MGAMIKKLVFPLRALEVEAKAAKEKERNPPCMGSGFEVHSGTLKVIPNWSYRH